MIGPTRLRTAGAVKKAPQGTRCLLTIVLSISVTTAGCGEQERPERAGGLTACLRDSGATLKEGPLFSPADAMVEHHRVTLKAGAIASVRVFASTAAAERMHTTLRQGGTAAVRKGETVVLYPGSSERDAALLETCLRSSGDPSKPRRRELADQVSRNEERREADIARYRDHQYGTPQEIEGALARLRSYGRYTLYYLGRRHGRWPLEAVLSRLQPPAYKQSYRPPEKLPPPSSPTFDFVYGSCQPPAGSEGGCSAPLDVQNAEICARNPHSYGIPPRALTQRVRGVPILRNEGSRAFEIYTGATTVVMFADNWRVATRAAEQLRSLDGRIGPKSKLPPPVAGPLEGRLRCRPPPK